MNKYKILIFLFCLILVGGILFSVYYFYPEKKVETNKDVLNIYKAIAENFSEVLTDLVIDEDTEGIVKKIKNLEKDEKISYFVVINNDGKIIGSLIENQIGKDFSSFYNFNLLERLNPNIKESGDVADIGIPVIFKGKEKDVKVGEIHLGLKIKEEGSVFPFEFLIKVGGISIILFIIVLILIQTLIFSDIQRQFAIYEKEHRAILSLEEVKNEKEKIKKEIEKLKEDKKKVEEEIEKVKEELMQRRKEVEESDIGKMVSELEYKRIELEKRIEELKEEENRLKESIELKKIEQDEIKKRLDVIREKMKRIIEG
jgi:prefoldin subunit 5